MSEEEMKALVEMKDMLKAENTKLKQEKEKLKKYFDEVQKRCNLMGLTTMGDEYDYAHETYEICRDILSKLKESDK